MPKDNDQKRELYLALFKAGGLPEKAWESDKKHSLSDYQNAVITNDYRAFAAEYAKLFVEGIEGNLLGCVEKMGKALNSLTPDDPNYPRITREYREFLKLTQPIVDKFKQIQAAGGVLINPEHLEIVIQKSEEKNKQEE